MSDNKILSAEDLEKNFQPEYPAYTIAQWRETVASGHTIEGYWHWVHTMLTEEAGLEEDMGETGDSTAEEFEIEISDEDAEKFLNG